MIVLLSQILGHLFKNSVLKYIHNSKHLFSFLPSNPNIKDITFKMQKKKKKKERKKNPCEDRVLILKRTLLVAGSKPNIRKTCPCNEPHF